MINQCRNHGRPHDPNEFFWADVTLSTVLVMTMATIYALITVRKNVENLEIGPSTGPLALM